MPEPSESAYSVLPPEAAKRLACAAIWASILFPAVGGAAKWGVDFYNATEQRALEQKKEEFSERQQQLAASREVAKLFLDSYRNAPAAEQAKTIEILKTFYPVEYAGAAKVLAQGAANQELRKEIQSAASAIEQGATLSGQSLGTSLKTASEAEDHGFDAIANRDLATARQYFGRAYQAFPTYHNVDEIYNKVLTESAVSDSKSPSGDDRNKAVSAVAREILAQYSWGMTAEQTERIRRLTS